MFYVYLVVILVLTANSQAKKIKLPPSHPYIYSLELKFAEDRINDYIVDSFFATNSVDGNKLLHCDITLSDLIKAIPIKQIAVSDFVSALEDLNLIQEDDDVNRLIGDLNYTELKSVGLTAGKIYKNVAKTYFKDRPADLLQCLNILGIAEEFSVAYTFGTDEDIFNALQSGNYSSYNLAEIQTLVGTPSSLKEILNVFGLKKLDGAVLSNFLNEKLAPALIQRGLTEDKLKNLLGKLNLSVSNYKDSKVFKKCYSSLTKETSLAVAVGQNELITNDDSILMKYLNLEPYTTLVARRLQDNGLGHVILADDIKTDEFDNIITIDVKGLLSNFLDLSKNEDSLSGKSCEYVSVNFEQLVSVNVWPLLLEEQLTVKKFFNTPFKKGSALVCDEKLYGLAAINRFDSIIFDQVQKKQKENIIPTVDNKPEIIQAIKDFFESIHPNFNPCKYLNCQNNKESESEEDSPVNKPSNDESISNQPCDDNDQKEEQENHSSSEEPGTDTESSSESVPDQTTSGQESITEGDNGLDNESSEEVNINGVLSTEQSNTELPPESNSESVSEAIFQELQESNDDTSDASNLFESVNAVNGSIEESTSSTSTVDESVPSASSSSEDSELIKSLENTEVEIGNVSQNNTVEINI